MKIAIILGTRPEIIKLSPVIRACEKHRIDYFIIHTNQHNSESIDRIFFDELKLPRPRYNLNVGSGTHAEETGRMLIGMEKVLQKEKPSIILVEGDTNTVLAGALAAAKLHIPVGHIEAGLRSYDRMMPEEINRILTDHISDYLFAPTKNAEENLLNEGISKEKVLITGNTVVDAVYQNLEISDKRSGVLQKLGLVKGRYLLVTCHRPSNVDHEEKFVKLFNWFGLLSKEFEIPLVFPIHPRSKKMLQKFNLKIPKNLMIVKPLGYLEFLQLAKNAKLILTDSGGIQEEACVMKVPCITLRENTERPETIDVGANILMSNNLLHDCKEMLGKKKDWQNPFGNGDSGEKIFRYLFNIFHL